MIFHNILIMHYAGLTLTIITRGVKRERHSPAQDRHSLPVPHSTSEHAQLLSNRPISVANPLSVSEGHHPVELSSPSGLSAARVIKVGFLSKTTQRQREGLSRREIAQRRRFRLTEDAFEYFQQFSWNVGWVQQEYTIGYGIIRVVFFIVFCYFFWWKVHDTIVIISGESEA